MPTTTNEATKVLEICKRHGMTDGQVLSVFHDLHKEVGEPSDNQSVKATMRLLYLGAERGSVPPAESVGYPVEELIPDERTVARPDAPIVPYFEWEEPALLAIVVLHWIYCLAMAAACICSLIYQPWYIAIVVISFTVFLASRSGKCLCTELENNLRQKLGWPLIDSFVVHYLTRVYANFGTRIGK